MRHKNGCNLSSLYAKKQEEIHKELERGKRGAKSSRFNMFLPGDPGLNASFFLGGFSCRLSHDRPNDIQGGIYANNITTATSRTQGVILGMVGTVGY